MSSVHSQDILSLKAWSQPLKLSQSRLKSTAQGIVSPKDQALANTSILMYNDGNLRYPIKQNRTATLIYSYSRSMSSLNPEKGLFEETSQYNSEGGNIKQYDGRNPSILSTRHYKVGEQAKLPDESLTRQRFPYIPQILFPKVIEDLQQLLQGVAIFSSSFLHPKSEFCSLTCTFLQDSSYETTLGRGLKKV